MHKKLHVCTTILDSANAMHCYVCSSLVSNNCNDEFNPYGIPIAHCLSCGKEKSEQNGTMSSKSKNIIDIILSLTNWSVNYSGLKKMKTVSAFINCIMT